MSIRALVSGKTQQGRVDELVTLLEELFPSTRTFEGCISIALLIDEDQPDQWTLLEEWESKDHHERYFAWRTESGTLEHFMELMDGELTKQYLKDAGI